MEFVRLDDLREWRENYIRSGKAKSYDDMTALLVFINSALSIDIVHCSECKYWKESQYYPEFMVCTYVMGATFTRQHDDFCSRGERSSE